MKWRLAFVLTFLFLGQSNADADDETSRLLKALETARGGAAGSPTAAWNQLVARGAPALPRILEAMDTPDTARANWLRTAFDRIVAEERKRANRTVDVEPLLAFAKQPKHQGRSRRLALETVEELRPGTSARLIAEWLDDPEFGYDAVDQLGKQADDQANAGQKNQARESYRRAFAASRDLSQAQRLLPRMQTVGESGQLVEQFGFITDWFVVGPFDGMNQQGFGTVYPPELQVDLAAEYPGKEGPIRWKRFQVREEPKAQSGRVALLSFGEPIGKIHDAVAYAYTAFKIPEDREVEFRGGGDDNFTVWVNGQREFGFEEYRNGIRLDRHRFKAKLKAGVNRVLVKVCQGPLDPTTNDASWELMLRLVDGTGKGIPIQSALPEKK